MSTLSVAQVAKSHKVGGNLESAPIFWLMMFGGFFATEALFVVAKRTLLRGLQDGTLDRARWRLRWLAWLAVAKNAYFLFHLFGPLLIALSILLPVLLPLNDEWGAFAVIGFAVTIVCSILFRSYFGAMTPVGTALWLRRFHSEPKGLNLARAFDLLSISAVRIITLADSKVTSSRLSSRQCYIKLVVDLFAFLIVPVALFASVLLASVNMLINAEAHHPPAFFRHEYYLPAVTAIGGLWMIYGLIRLLTNIHRIIILGTGVVKLDAEGTKVFVATENDRARSGRADSFFSGKAVLRIGDAYWEKAVEAAIEEADYIVFDATEFSQNLLWELQTVVRLGCASKLIIASEGEGIADGFQRYFEEKRINWRTKLASYAGFSNSFLGALRYSHIMERTIFGRLQASAAST